MSENHMSKPRLSKIVVSMGIGQASQDRKKLESAAKDLGLITGQRPAITRARQSISGFRLREGMEVGCFVTLRGKRMRAFFERVTKVVLPRVRDFRGLRRTSFDGQGNYSFGLTEQGVFPEVDSSGTTAAQGMNICIVTTAGSDSKAEELLRSLGLPFERSK